MWYRITNQTFDQKLNIVTYILIQMAGGLKSQLIIISILIEGAASEKGFIKERGFYIS